MTYRSKTAGTDRLGESAHTLLIQTDLWNGHFPDIVRPRGSLILAVFYQGADMNWEAVAAIAEAVGAIAVVVSLIYVALQIRQSTQQFARGVEANQLAAFERNIESGNRIREILILNPDLAQLFLKGFASYEDLQRADKFRFSMLLRNIFSGMQGGYIRQLSVDHDPQKFEGSTRVLDEILIHPGVREWLEHNDPDWRPEFRELVDQRLAAIKQRQAEPPT